MSKKQQGPQIIERKTVITNFNAKYAKYAKYAKDAKDAKFAKRTNNILYPFINETIKSYYLERSLHLLQH